MSTTIGQQTLTSIDVAQASSGNVVIMQDASNEDTASVSVELAALPYLIKALQHFLPARTKRATKENTR